MTTTRPQSSRRFLCFCYYLTTLWVLDSVPVIRAFPPPSSIAPSSFQGRPPRPSNSNNSSNSNNPMTKPTKPSGSNPSQPYRSPDAATSSTKLGLSVLPLMDLSNPLWTSVGIYVAADALGFLVSLVTKSHLHLDLIGTGAFALGTLPMLLFPPSNRSPSQFISSMSVAIWAVKLAGFLLYRALQVRHDARLTDTMSSTSGIFGFWFITLLWNVVCSLPHLLGLLSNEWEPNHVQVGGFVFWSGLMIETIADGQKWFFKQNHPGKFCHVGLWSYSQHPNFFGNLLLWAGIFLMNLPALILPAKASSSSSSWLATLWTRYHRVALALLSPLFMYGLFYGEATGTITNAAQLAEAKYGSDPAFRKYMEQVPPIFPKLWE